MKKINTLKTLIKEIEELNREHSNLIRDNLGMGRRILDYPSIMHKLSSVQSEIKKAWIDLEEYYCREDLDQNYREIKTSQE